MALTYLFWKETDKLKEFTPNQFIKKHMVEKDGILLCKNRMLERVDFIYTGELSVDLRSLGIKTNKQVLDRYSPLVYSISQHVHSKLPPPTLCGMETHYRVALEHVFIMQSMSLFRELCVEYIRCNMSRKKAPPLWVAQMDLFGPYWVFVPGF